MIRAALRKLTRSSSLSYEKLHSLLHGNDSAAAGLVRREIQPLRDECEARHREIVARHEEIAARHAEINVRHEEINARHAEINVRHEEVAAQHREFTQQRNEVGGERIAQIEALLAELSRRQTQLAGEVAELMGRHSNSIAWLAEQLQTLLPATPDTVATGPLVSVIMPVWNRAGWIGTAIESVLAQTYRHWELLVVDDGSTDATSAAVARYLDDSRIQYLHQAHVGVSAARNRGLESSRGEIIAYLDSDNTWFPRYLEEVTGTLNRHPQRQSVYLAQLVRDRTRNSVFVRAEPFDGERLAEGNYIDLNVFAHRRRLVERCGGFDESLTAGVDWDLILRYTRDTEPLQAAALGGRYEAGHADRITVRESGWLNMHRVKRKLEKPLSQPLRVLYALHHYPQLSETYIATELNWMRRKGVHIEVWRQQAPLVPYPSDVCVHESSLRAAIERFQPDVVHSHWSTTAESLADELRPTGLPLTVRDHGFDFSAELVAALDRHPSVAAMFMFPHRLRLCPAGTRQRRAVAVSFNPDLHYPESPKDRSLVFRAGLAKTSKNPFEFLHIARQLPNHHFVMALCRNSAPELERELVECNRELGSPVDIQFNLAHADAAALSRKAGIYLHTYSTEEPYGMPISIAEAMASGSYLIGWHCSFARDYIGDAGNTYSSVEEAAALIQETEGWSDEQWRRAELTSIDRAYRLFVDATALQPILAEWLSLTRQSRIAA